MVCPEALFSPRNGPPDPNNMLERVFMVLIRMFQAGRVWSARRAAGKLLSLFKPEGNSSPADRWEISLAPRFLFFPGSSTRKRIQKIRVGLHAGIKPLLFCWPLAWVKVKAGLRLKGRKKMAS